MNKRKEYAYMKVRTKKVVCCKPREHKWGPDITIREPAFNVAYGSYKICLVCNHQLIESWCGTRASGGILKVYPPNTIPGHKQNQAE